MLTAGELVAQEHTIKANGIEIYYQEIGTGAPLILLHGGTATSGSWQDHIAAFAKHFRVLALDWRGHGKTNNPSGEFSYASIADDIVTFIKALDLTKPFIVGYSDGGQIALDLGIRYPDVAGALALGGIAYKFTDLYYETIKGYGFEAPGVVHIEGDDWIEYLKTEHKRDDDPEYWKTLVKQISYMWWRPLEYTDNDLKKIAAPTLISLGDRDGVEVEQAVEMYRLIPNSELAIIPNADHGGAVGSLYGTIVTDFLVRHKTESQGSS